MIFYNSYSSKYPKTILILLCFSPLIDNKLLTTNKCIIIILTAFTMFSLTMVKNWFLLLYFPCRHQIHSKLRMNLTAWLSLRTCEAEGSVSEARLTAVDNHCQRQRREDSALKKKQTLSNTYCYTYHFIFPFKRWCWKEMTHRTLARGCRICLNFKENLTPINE